MTDVERQVAFVEAQIAEDERVARAAIPDRENRPTTYYPDEDEDDGIWGVARGGSQVEGVGIIVYDEGGHTAGQAEHIARHDPARVLREVEGKRQIIARYQDAVARTSDFDHSTAVAELQVREYEDFVLPGLLAAYVNRPGFDPLWLSEEAPDGQR